MTSEEMLDAVNDGGLRGKVLAAIPMAAEVIRAKEGKAHIDHVVWAQKALVDPERYVTPMLRGIVARCAELTLAQLRGADDAAIRGCVNDLVGLFAVREKTVG